MWLKKIRKLSDGNEAGAEVWLVEVEGQRMVLKDASGKGLLVRRMVRKEADCYRLLDGTDGVPRFIGVPWRDAFLIEEVDGDPLHESNVLSDRTFTLLEELVDNVHKRGILHLDLGHRSNVVVREDGTPFVIDFGACVRSRLLVRLFGWVDRLAVLRLKSRYLPSAVTVSERRRVMLADSLHRLWFPKKIRDFLRCR